MNGQSTADRLLDAAETRMRSGGFHAVSFRDLAEDLSIKSASVHYYYRRKEDLGAAVVARYAARFLDHVNQIAGSAADANQRLAAICAGFRKALVEADQVCLCGVLGAETLGLPQAVRVEVAKFLDAMAAWLAEGYVSAGNSVQRARAKALTVLATLQGAMILSVSLNDMDAFESVVAELTRQDSAVSG